MCSRREGGRWVTKWFVLSVLVLFSVSVVALVLGDCLRREVLS